MSDEQTTEQTLLHHLANIEQHLTSLKGSIEIALPIPKTHEAVMVHRPYTIHTIEAMLASVQACKTLINESTEFHVGDEVMHPMNGKGVVLPLPLSEQYVLVQFENKDRPNLLAVRYAKLTKAKRNEDQ